MSELINLSLDKQSPKLAMTGNYASLLDYSAHLLSDIRNTYHQSKCTATFILSDLRQMHARGSTEALTV